MSVQEKLFGYINGLPVTLFTVKNNNGFEVSCMNYGCVITKVLASDRTGQYENVVLGYDTLEEYDHNPKYLGAVVGRVAGRISGDSFCIGEDIYNLQKNDKNNHIHGGLNGFSHTIWNATVLEGDQDTTIEFTYLSADGEEGYPGNLEMKVNYTILHEEDTLLITYTGISDKDTLVNVTNHSYFNLSGNLKRDVLGHALTMDSPLYLELNEEFLPTGNIVPVENSVFDFREGRKIMDGVASVHPQNVLVGNGYDHPFLFTENELNAMLLTEVESGRKLVVETTESAVVFYTGNNMGNAEIMRGEELRDYLGLCLETQGPPDSIHHPHFLSSILRAGDEYKTTTIYSFGVIAEE
ncbi:aldose epimerase family protein [Psychrobacillus psychrotolerans]|uniref:aldose epimerase family protein n=1 Tax=Psychrobacillus psychrotolerans TaxID=126156 RepID=UPI0039892007